MYQLNLHLMRNFPGVGFLHTVVEVLYSTVVLVVYDNFANWVSQAWILREVIQKWGLSHTVVEVKYSLVVEVTYSLVVLVLYSTFENISAKPVSCGKPSSGPFTYCGRGYIFTCSACIIWYLRTYQLNLHRVGNYPRGPFTYSGGGQIFTCRAGRNNDLWECIS